MDARRFEDVVLAPGGASARVTAAHLAHLCAGHFPGDPLVPGAYLLGLMAELAAELTRPLRLLGIERGVLAARVRPGGEVHVRAARRPTDPVVVDAEIRVGDRRAAWATLRFGPPS